MSATSYFENKTTKTGKTLKYRYLFQLHAYLRYEIRPFSASAAVLACITFHRSPIIASRASLTDALRQDLYRKEELAQVNSCIFFLLPLPFGMYPL